MCLYPGNGSQAPSVDSALERSHLSVQWTLACRQTPCSLFQTPNLEPSVPYSQTFGIIVSYECPEDRSGGNYQEDFLSVTKRLNSAFLNFHYQYS